MSAFSFPVLSVSELVSWLSGLDRPVPPLTAADIAAPSSAQVKIVYYQFVEMLLGLSAEALQQPKFEHLEALGEYPNLHEKSIVESAYIKALCDIMRVVGVSDFTFRDLVYPDRKRTIRNFSAIINFAKFRQDRMESFQEHLEQTNRLRAKKADLEDRNDHLQAQLEALNKTRKAEEPEKARLTAEIDETSQRLSELQKQASGTRQDIREEKQRIQKLNESLETDQFSRFELRKVVETLKSQIVRSPEKLKQTLSTMGDNIESHKRANEETRASIRQLEAKLAQLNKAERKIHKRTGDVDEIAELLQKSKTLSKEIKQATSECTAHEDAIEQLAGEEKHLQDQISRASSKYYSMQKQFEKKRTQAHMQLAEVNASKMEVEERMAEQMSTLEKISTAIEAKRAEMDEKKANHAQQVSNMLEKYESLRCCLATYHDKLTQAMDSQGAFDYN